MMDSFSKFNSEFKKQTSLQNGKINADWRRTNGHEIGPTRFIYFNN